MFGFNWQRPGGGQGGNLQSIWDHITANRPELAAMIQQRMGQWMDRRGPQPAQPPAQPQPQTGRPPRVPKWENPNHPRYGQMPQPKGRGRGYNSGGSI